MTWVVCGVCLLLGGVFGMLLSRRFKGKAPARQLLEQLSYRQTLVDASTGMTRIRELPKLLDLLVHLLTRSVRVSSAGIFLLSDQTGQGYVLKASRDRQSRPGFRLTNEQTLVRLLGIHRAPVTLDGVKREALKATGERARVLQKLVSEFEQRTIAMVVPSFIEHELVGFFALGPKLSGQPYTQDDHNFFITVANQAALVIENAQYYQKERERQAELFHAASIADLGTMASSMSHQINNPLCIISGTAQTREEQLRRSLKQDTWSPEQIRQLLQTEIESLQSITEESNKGSNIIATIRGITASTEAARPLLVLEAVNVALPIVKHKVPFERLDFSRELPDSLPRIWGDKAQLAQCIISFLENAWDAIQARQGDRHLPPPPLGYKGLIRLAGSTMTEPDPSTKQRTEWVVLTISDNGIGLKPEDLRKLFIPFFTTKPTAEKAFGSLFVVRRIIEAHGGTVSAESTYGVGTTFKVKLPVLTDEETARRITAGRVAGNGPVRPAK